MADVSIDASVSTSTARGCRSVVFIAPSTGYWFYIDSGGTFVYSKTTDGGATWGAAVTIASATTHLAFDVWYDQWTPGDNTGTLIYTWYFDTTNDAVRWRSLDTNGDSLGTERTAFAGASAVAGNNAYVSGTKAVSGYLYCCTAIDASNEQYFGRSTDSGTTWSAALSATFQEANPDHALLFPASGTGDNNDIWAIYEDSSATAITMKMWDSSAAAQVESSTVQTIVGVGTDLTAYQYPYSGSIRKSDGALFLVSISERDTATCDMQCWIVTGVTAASLTGITAKTDITTNIDDNYNPQTFIDQTTNNLYVAYNGKRDGSEVIGTTTKVYYTKSTDGGTSWTSGDTAYMEGAAGIVIQVWSSISGTRFYVGWRVGSTLLGNKVSSLTFAFTSSVTGSLSFVGTTINNTARALSAALSFAGSITKGLRRSVSGSLSFVGNLSISKVFTRTLSGTLSFAGNVAKFISAPLSATLSFVGTSIKSSSRAVAGTLSFVGSVAKRELKAMSASLTSSATLANKTSRSLPGSLTMAGVMTKILHRSLTATVSSVGTFVKTCQKNMAGFLTTAGAITKRITHPIASAFSFIGSLATQLFTSGTEYFQSLTGTLSFAGSLRRSAARGLSGALSFTSAVSFAHAFTRLLTGALSFAGGLLAGHGMTQLLEGSISFSGTIARSTAKALAASIGFVGNVSRFIGRGISGVLSLVGTIATHVISAFRPSLVKSVKVISPPIPITATILKPGKDTPAFRS